MNNFGEIIEPSTRTAWEDWDDYEGLNSNSCLAWQTSVKLPIEIDTLIIIDGKYLVNYIQKKTCLQLECIDCIPDINLNLFQIKGSNNYMCLIKDYDLIKSSEALEMMKDYIINSKNVIVLQNKPLLEYQTMTQFQDDCIIRKISTPNTLSSLFFPNLEQPNIISGIGAGALLLREQFKLNGVAYICYIESIEEYVAVQLQELLENLGIKLYTKQKIINDLNSNLYI